MVAGKRTAGKPRKRWEKDITDTLGTTMAAASKVAEDRHQHLGSDVLKGICSQKKILKLYEHVPSVILSNKVSSSASFASSSCNQRNSI